MWHQRNFSSCFRCFPHALLNRFDVKLIRTLSLAFSRDVIEVRWKSLIVCAHSDNAADFTDVFNLSSRASWFPHLTDTWWWVHFVLDSWQRSLQGPKGHCHGCHVQDLLLSTVNLWFLPEEVLMCLCPFPLRSGSDVGQFLICYSRKYKPPEVWLTSWVLLNALVNLIYVKQFHIRIYCLEQGQGWALFCLRFFNSYFDCCCNGLIELKSIVYVWCF